MSYRDLRNFTEMMRSLGYHRLISVENFRTPNFPLVAEVLNWLVKRYDPNEDIPMDIDTEQDRIIFIKTAAQFMALKAHIKLNTKKLYQADGYAVKELLKVTSVLYNAMKTNVSDYTADEEDTSTLSFDISAKLNDLKEARRLASEITTQGAALFDALAREVDLREVRAGVLAKSLEITDVEKGIKNAIKAVGVQIEKTMTNLKNVASDEATLEAKIEKKKAELERNQKRLANLQQVRPAYMDQYEGMEKDLEKLYENYMERFRNVAYLEQQLEEVNRRDKEGIMETEGSLQRIKEEIQKEESRLDRRGMDIDSDDDFQGGFGDESDDSLNEATRPRPAHGQRPGEAATGYRTNPRGDGGKPVVVGSMMGAISDDDDDEDDDSGDMSDMDDMEGDEEEDSEEEPIMGGGHMGGRPQNMGRPPPPMDDDQDSDF